MLERVIVVTLSVCLCVTFLFWKASGILALTAVIYVGTAQSLKGLAPEFLAHEALYQLSFAFRFLRSVSSLHIVTGLQRLLSFLAIIVG